MQSFTIGGVPEHYNYPWHLANEHQLFQKQGGFEVQWRDFPGGTGAMVQAVVNAEVDAALVLTEGALKAIHGGADIQVLGTYVRSSLEWGVHVHRDSPYEQPADLKGSPFAISRQGSGSQLMAYVYAREKGWSVDQLSFEVVGSLPGAQQSLPKAPYPAFMWEKIYHQAARR